MFQRKESSSQMTRITYQREKVEMSYDMFFQDLLSEPEFSENIFNYGVSDNMPNTVNDERLYHLISFELSRDLTNFKLEKPELFTGLALAAGLLAAF